MRRTRISRTGRWARGLIAAIVAVSLSGWTVTPATDWPGGVTFGCPIGDGWQTLGLTPQVSGLYLCQEGPYGQAYLANNTQQVWGVTTTLADPAYRYNYVRSTTRTKLFRTVTSTRIKYALPGEVLLLPASFMQNSFTINRALSTRWMYFDVLSTALPVGATALAKKSPKFNAFKTCFLAGWTAGARSARCRMAREPMRPSEPGWVPPPARASARAR
ncbi:hypothetical protein [Leifsonia poae]|uniref:hypothetical protein n=1 Tax=Leifsonia poae TaxID=110933 RepID=UPI003D66FF9A